jgi:hypothetical protein
MNELDSILLLPPPGLLITICIIAGLIYESMFHNILYLETLILNDIIARSLSAQSISEPCVPFLLFSNALDLYQINT